LITPTAVLLHIQTIYCVTGVEGMPATRRHPSSWMMSTVTQNRTAEWRWKPQWYRHYEGTLRKNKSLIRNNQFCQEVNVG